MPGKLFKWYLIAVVLILAAPVAGRQTEKGIDLYKTGKYKEAETELQKVVAAEPDNVRAQYYLGLSYLELKQYKEAQERLQKAESMTTTGAPTLDQIKVALGRVYIDQRQFEKAKTSLDEAKRINGKNAGAYVYTGKLDLERKDNAAAVKELEKAIELNPDDAYAHYYAGIAYGNTRRPDKMVQQFQIFLKLAPDAPEAPKVRSLLKGVR